ncbi:F0F1 ATP synthase subunit delta [Parabacteroides sp. PF5-9]|uniref:F0F1 ATP synthase subunit delta n=1 Tax=Parabacteroides sp. PF5-9 TaxID=1742404 RepID=UPI0024768961|nr:F0F1 ATP synthase subunit delta [Parabacteroides sp. PF5-9]MDH6358014.1 F-type H+-transporting ATPase subunit delta [Parabacteroides sp. PF5-9]
MDTGTISRRYAVALYKYAHMHGKEKQIYDETLRLSKSYTQFEALRRTVANPVLSKAKKEEVLCLAAGGETSDEFLNFLRLIIRQKREFFLEIICLDYQAIYRNEHKLLHMQIVTAVPIDSATKEQLVKKLEQLTNETVDIDETVDPSIIGGYVIKWDTYRWDASTATRLRQIKKELTERVKMD